MKQNPCHSSLPLYHQKYQDYFITSHKPHIIFSLFHNNQTKLYLRGGSMLVLSQENRANHRNSRLQSGLRYILIFYPFISLSLSIYSIQLLHNSELLLVKLSLTERKPRSRVLCKMERLKILSFVSHISFLIEHKDGLSEVGKESLILALTST